MSSLVNEIFAGAPHQSFLLQLASDNVTDQLALWEAENYRIKAQDAIVIECRDAIQSALLSFSTTAVSVTEIFDGLVASMKKVDLLLWHNKEALIIAVAPVDNFVRVIQSYIESSVAQCCSLR